MEAAVRLAGMLMAIAWLGAAAAHAQVAPPVVPLPSGAAPGSPRNATIYLVEQLIVPGKLPPTLAEKLKPLKTLQQVEDLLKTNNLPFGWQRGQLNTALLDPRLVQEIDRLPPGEVFVIPQADRV